MRQETPSERPFPYRDQHLMTNPDTADKIVAAANLKHCDYVLEIGAGSGLLTVRLARKGARILAIEMDRRFATTLGKIEAANVEIIYANAIDMIEKIKFNKVVSNIPYAICEPLISRLMKKDFELAVLSVPESFYKILVSKPGDKTHSILSLKAQSFFSTELLFGIEKSDFSPEPKTESVAISIRPLLKSDYAKNPNAFVFRELFLQKTKKLGNALAEALINTGRMFSGEQLTKRTAKAKIKEMDLGKLLQKKVEEMQLDDFLAVEKKLTISS